MPKKPDFGQELDNNVEREASPVPGFETLYGDLNLPDDVQQTAIAESRGYRYTASGLDIQRDLTIDEFREGLLPEIEAAQSAYQLIVGDACLYGLEHGFIESYEDMAELIGYTAGTIEMYTSLCRSIPRLVRTNSLTYSHYQKIAPLPEEERPLWIKFAADSGLSYRALDALIQWTKGNPQLPAGTGIDDIEDDEPPSPAQEKEPLIIVHRSPLKDKVHHQRMNYIWRKVEKDEALTDEDLGDVQMIREWADTLLEQHRKRK